jgi:hypothetical protein
MCCLCELDKLGNQLLGRRSFRQLKAPVERNSVDKLQAMQWLSRSGLGLGYFRPLSDANTDLHSEDDPACEGTHGNDEYSHELFLVQHRLAAQRFRKIVSDNIAEGPRESSSHFFLERGAKNLFAIGRSARLEHCALWTYALSDVHIFRNRSQNRNHLGNPCSKVIGSKFI